MAEQTPQLSDEFRDFLIEAKQNGYGTKNARKMSIPSGGTEIVYQDGDWLYTDNYVGGDPFVGYEHVSYKRKNGKEFWLPIWGMSYRGQVLNPDFSSSVFSALNHVLAKPEYEMPIRGPFSDTWKDKGYRLQYDGTLEKFMATERFHNGEDVYLAHFLGGLANRQAWEDIEDKPWIEIMDNA